MAPKSWGRRTPAPGRGLSLRRAALGKATSGRGRPASPGAPDPTPGRGFSDAHRGGAPRPASGGCRQAGRKGKVGSSCPDPGQKRALGPNRNRPRPCVWFFPTAARTGTHTPDSRHRRRVIQRLPVPSDWAPVVTATSTPWSLTGSGGTWPRPLLTPHQARWGRKWRPHSPEPGLRPSAPGRDAGQVLVAPQ